MPRDVEIYRSEDVRERRTFEKRKSKIVSFRVQLEVLVSGEWKPIKRWDSSHGFVDCDSYNLQGEKRKTILLAMTLEEGLTHAQEDLNRNWERYRARFLRGLFP